MAGEAPNLEIWREVSRDMFAQFRALEGAGSPGEGAGGPGSSARGSVGLVGPSGAQPGSMFKPVRVMFEEAYRRVLPRFGLEGRVDPARAAGVVMAAHAQCPPYPETVAFLREARPVFDLCVASDADKAVLDAALANAGIEEFLDLRVCSEAVGAYKSEPDGWFFDGVLAALGRRPDEVAHVGDGESDVVGAHRAGLVTVWVSRYGRRWMREDVMPDVVVGDLGELADLLVLPSATGRWRRGAER